MEHRDPYQNDADLVAVLRSTRDEWAFRALYERHTPRLLGFVHRILGGNTAAAEDAVQETWIRVCRGIDGFRGEAAFSSWLIGIGLNVVRSHLRRVDVRRIVGEDQAPEAAAPPRQLVWRGTPVQPLRDSHG